MWRPQYTLTAMFLVMLWLCSVGLLRKGTKNQVLARIDATPVAAQASPAPLAAAVPLAAAASQTVPAFRTTPAPRAAPAAPAPKPAAAPSAADAPPPPPAQQLGPTPGSRQALEGLKRIGVEWTAATIDLPLTLDRGLHFVDYGPGSLDVPAHYVLTRTATDAAALDKFRRTIANVAAFCKYRKLVQVIGIWPKPGPPRSGNFAKVLTVRAALDLLPQAKLVFHIDLDMWFTIRAFAMPPELIGGDGRELFPGWFPLAEDWHVAIQDDYPLQNQNSGFFAVRQSAASRTFLSRWWDEADDRCCIHPNLKDQECYHEAILSEMQGHNGFNETIECRERQSESRPGGWKQPSGVLDAMDRDWTGMFQQRKWHFVGNARMDALTTYGAMFYNRQHSMGDETTVLTLGSAMNDPHVRLPPLSKQKWGNLRFLPLLRGPPLERNGKFVNGLAHDIDQYRLWRMVTPSLLYHSGGAKENWMFHQDLIFVPRDNFTLPAPWSWHMQEMRLLDYVCFHLNSCMFVRRKNWHPPRSTVPPWPLPDDWEPLKGDQGAWTRAAARKLLYRVRLRGIPKAPLPCSELHKLLEELYHKRVYPGAFENYPLHELHARNEAMYGRKEK